MIPILGTVGLAVYLNPKNTRTIPVVPLTTLLSIFAGIVYVVAKLALLLVGHVTVSVFPAWL